MYAARRRLFGQHLRNLRDAAGLSQEELALRAEIARNYIGGIEAGERSVGLDVVFALADALHVSSRELMPD